MKLIPVGYFMTFLLAFTSALGLRQHGRSKVVQAAVLSLASEGAIVAATWDRYHRVGTKEQWEDGTASELFASKPQGLAKKVSSYGPLVAGAFVLGLILTRRSRR